MLTEDGSVHNKCRPTIFNLLSSNYIIECPGPGCGKTYKANIPELKEQNEKILIDQIREFTDKTLTERLPVEFLLENGDFLWEQYYETQFLEQRLNTRLFHRFIPKYVMKKANMDIEKKFYEDVLEKPEETRTLDSFFKKNAIVK